MGYVYADIELTNEEDLALQSTRHVAGQRNKKSYNVEHWLIVAPMDLVINEEIQERLDLPVVVGKRSIRLADETILEVDIVGPVEVRFEDRAHECQSCLSYRTLEEVLLGAIPLGRTRRDY